MRDKNVKTLRSGKVMRVFTFIVFWVSTQYGENIACTKSLYVPH